MVKKLKGGNYTNSNSFAANVTPSVNSSVNSINSKEVSSITKYLIVGGLILLFVIAIGLGVYFYKKHHTKSTDVPTSVPTEIPTSVPTLMGPYHPLNLLGNNDNKNNHVVAVITGQLKDFGSSYTKLEKEDKRKFKRCFKNPLNTNCSF